MSTLFIQDTTLTAIADAIRSKRGETTEVVIVDRSYTVDANVTWFSLEAEESNAFEKLVSGDMVHVEWTVGNKVIDEVCAVTVLSTGRVDFDESGWFTGGFTDLAYYQGALNVCDGDGIYTGRIKISKSGGASYKPTEMPKAILGISGEGGSGFVPEGELEITENGSYDVTDYASAAVNVPVGVFPTGTLQITSNGEHIVTNYDKVNVVVASSGGSDNVADSIIGRSISGSYTNSTVLEIGQSAFYNCAQLTDVAFSETRRIYNQAFYLCSNLKTVNFPKCTRLDGNIFGSCSSLSEIYFPNLEVTIGSDFQDCRALKKADFPMMTSLGMRTFYNCSNLETLILRKTTKVTYNTAALYGTKIANGNGGYVYVPRALISEYEADSNWKLNAPLFRAIEDYPDICG